MSVVYLHLQPGEDLPKQPIERPFKAVLILELEVNEEWQYETSKWLVQAGCLYMLAWGKNCSSWDDSVDFANLEEYNYEEIPDNSFVMTTWHENELLEEVLGFAKMSADHLDVEIHNILLLHIASYEDKKNILSTYKKAWE